MKIVLFEDDQYPNLLPSVYFQPVWEMRCGIDTLARKIARLFPADTVSYIARDYLAQNYLAKESVFSMENSEESYFINGRLLLQQKDIKKIKELPPNTILKSGDSVAAWRGKPDRLSAYFNKGVLISENILNDFNVTEDELNFIDFPWDPIFLNGEQIRQDTQALKKLGKIEGQIDNGAHLIGKENTYIGKNSRIMPGAVINAEDGPVWIGDNCVVMSQAVVEGPFFLGDNSRIKIAAKIYPNTSIGEVCKVGGEVEDAIIQSYSNKQHEGFLGHSYLGSWINIGADTNNSDLKNNYGEISIYLHNRTISTGKQFLGVIMGDHTKTSINSMINTGSIIGACCNIFGEGFPPKYTPSFSWGGGSGLRKYQFDKCIEVAEKVMNRRKINFSDKHYRLFEAVRKLADEVENRARVS